MINFSFKQLKMQLSFRNNIKANFLLCFHKPAFIHFPTLFLPFILADSNHILLKLIIKTEKIKCIQLSIIFLFMTLTPILHYPNECHYFILFYTELNYLLFLHIVHTNYSRFGKSMLFSTFPILTEKSSNACANVSLLMTFMSPHLLGPLPLHCYNLPKPSAFNM